MNPEVRLYGIMSESELIMIRMKYHVTRIVTALDTPRLSFDDIT